MKGTMTMRLVVFTGLLLTFQPVPVQSQTDPCTDYELLDIQEGRRERTYEPQLTDQLHCDYGLDQAKWWRFVRDDISYEISERKCVDINHCGTQGPLWIENNSPHPSVVGEEVEAKACTNYGFSGHCCSVFGKITVRFCEDDQGDRFYVYRLPNPPGCFTGYCVDPVDDSCKPNFRRTANGACISVYPPQTAPTLIGPTIVGNTIEFYCQMTYAGAADLSTDAHFEVTFLFDGMADPDVPVVTLTAGDTALLNETHLQGHLGTELSCSSTPYWLSVPDEKGSSFRSSEGYFIGVRADTNRLDISEADDVPQKVSLKSTLPVLCKDHSSSCSVCTRVIAEGTALTDQQCEYCFKPEDWKPTENMAYDLTSPLQVSAVKSQRLDEPSIYFIDFEPFLYSDEYEDGQDALWTGYQMNDIAVNFVDANYGLCSATCDPHIRSFDRKYYHVYDIGQFVMWKSSAARYFEVHVRFWRCSPDARISCVCAVTVREGNAILGVDLCGSTARPGVSRPKIKNYSPWALPTGAFVSTNGANSYFINMPSGAYVKADVFKWGLNIYMHALAEDQNNSSGLCGNFDGDGQNDLRLKGTGDISTANDEITPIPRDFSESYRIAQQESFFDSVPQWFNLPDPDVTKCRCNDDVIECSPQADRDSSGSAQGLTSTVAALKQRVKGTNGGQRRRRKRDVDDLSDDVDDEEEPEFDYGEGFVPDTTFTWPTPSGITEAEARDICEATLDALPYKDDCLINTDIDIEDSVTECMEDIKIMDNTMWASASVGTFETRCQFLVLQNRTLYSEGPDGELQPPSQILGKMCPSDCSGYGTCQDALCTCSSGFTGVDCSLEEGAVPVLHYIPGNGRCDLTQRPCRQFRLVASQFQNSEQLTCRVMELSSKAVAGDSPVIHDQTVMSTSDGTATFVTAAEISCKLPDITSQDMAYYQLRFDFSYDGVQYSNQVDLTVFDGECLECDNDCDNPDNWAMRSDSCIIDGRCMKSGDRSTHDSCLICDPDQSKDKWTSLDGNCDKETSTFMSTPHSTESSSTTTTNLHVSTTTGRVSGVTEPSSTPASTRRVSTPTGRVPGVTEPSSTPASTRRVSTTPQKEPTSTLSTPLSVFPTLARTSSDDEMSTSLVAGFIVIALLLIIIAVILGMWYNARYTRGKRVVRNIYEVPMRTNAIYGDNLKPSETFVAWEDVYAKIVLPGSDCKETSAAVDTPAENHYESIN